MALNMIARYPSKMSKPVFQTIGLISKFGAPNVTVPLNRIISYLLSRQIRVLLDENSAELIVNSDLEIANISTIGTQCDLVIITGGDGTMLNAARSLVEYEVPILGINLGRLGFLADISPEKITKSLDEIIYGYFCEAQRSLLKTVILQEGQVAGESTALNDIVVHRRDAARMIEIDAFLDGYFLNTYRADGLIISTPTGSTAYALAGGGPIMHPGLEAVVLVPICPHTLTHRPIVVRNDSTIEIVLHTTNTTQTQVTSDGQISICVEPGARINIRKSERKIKFVHPVDYDYFELLRAKLGWGLKPDFT